MSELLAIVATLLTATFLVPQIVRLLSRGDTAGLSAVWAGFGVVTNLAWVGYIGTQNLWVAAIAPAMAVVTYSITLALIMHRSPGIGWWRSSFWYSASLVTEEAQAGPAGLGSGSPDRWSRSDPYCARMGGEMRTSPRRSDQPGTRAHRTTWGEDLITVILASWLTFGGFVDGFAHRNLDTPETFFTPWHAVLYSGFLAVAFWLAWLVIRDRPRALSLTGAIPFGYGTSVAGVVVFMAGALGDMLWHTVFGIEVSIDALLSPTHLLLLIGALLILSGPLRAAWFDHDPPPGLRPLLPPVLATTMATAQLGFFFQYMDGTSVRFMGTPYVLGSELGYFSVVAGVGSVLITTMILMGALLLLMRRWVLPFGAGLVLFGGFGLLMELLEGLNYPQELIAPVLAGLAVDLLARALRPGSDGPAPVRILAFAVPVVMWIAHFGLFSMSAEINWPVPVWTGLIFFSGLAGVGLSLLVFPFRPAVET
jgi:hypothetical protein